MVELVGTRLRLLEMPLKNGPAGSTCDVFLQTSRKFAIGQFEGLINEGTGGTGKGSVFDVLERIVMHEAGTGAVPKFSQLSDASRKADFSKVLYVCLDHTITFQSQLHRIVWGETRGQFVRELQ